MSDKSRDIHNKNPLKNGFDSYQEIKLPRLNGGLTELIKSEFKKNNIDFDNTSDREMVIEHMLGEIKSHNPQINNIDKVYVGDTVSIPQLQGMTPDELIKISTEKSDYANVHNHDSHDKITKHAKNSEELNNQIEAVQKFVSKFNEFKSDPTNSLLGASLFDQLDSDSLRQVDLEKLPKNIGLPSKEDFGEMINVTSKNTMFDIFNEQQPFHTEAFDKNGTFPLLSAIEQIKNDPTDESALSTIRDVFKNPAFENAINENYQDFKDSHQNLPSLDNLHRLQRGADLTRDINEISVHVGRELIMDTVGDIKNHQGDNFQPNPITLEQLDGSDNIRRFVSTINEYKEHPENEYLLNKLNDMINLNQLDPRHNDRSGDGVGLPSEHEIDVMKDFVHESMSLSSKTTDPFNPKALTNEITELTTSMDHLRTNTGDAHDIAVIDKHLNDDAFMAELSNKHVALKKAFPDLPSIDDTQNLLKSIEFINSNDGLAQTIGKEMLSDTLTHINENVQIANIPDKVKIPDTPEPITQKTKLKF